MKVRPENEAQKANNPPPTSVFNQAPTAGEILWGTMSESNPLKDYYHELFQPDPALDSYGLPPPNYDNSRLGPLASQVHALLGNWVADLLTLNAAQHAILTDLIQNVHHDY